MLNPANPNSGTTPKAPAGPLMLPCPCCRQDTNSLKQYTNLHFFLFLAIFVSVQKSNYVGCPKCMRTYILERAAINMLSANLCWPFLILPWSTALLLATLTKGHSESILDGMRQRQRATAMAQQRALQQQRQTRPTPKP